MAVPEIAPERVQRYFDQVLARMAYLRATGPNPFDYFQWADESTNILRGLFGDGSDEVAAFRLAVAGSGRTVDQRGILDNMTLGLHGEWGIWARLNRAQEALRQMGARPKQAATPH